MWNQPDEVKGGMLATTGTQAVDRAALLVSTVVQADEPLSFADLQDACDLAKSTTSRMLTALERSELLERRDDGSYVAGGLFWLYAARHDPGEDLVRLAGPMLKAVGEATHETVNLSMARGERVVQVAQVDSAVPARDPRLDPGRRTRALLVARQGVPRLGRRATPRRTARPTDRRDHDRRRPARRLRAQPQARLGHHRRRARGRARRRRRTRPGRARPGRRRPGRLGTHANDSRPGSTSWAGC